MKVCDCDCARNVCILPIVQGGGCHHHPLEAKTRHFGEVFHQNVLVYLSGNRPLRADCARWNNTKRAKEGAQTRSTRSL